MEELIESIVDSVVHQWTSVKVSNADWTGMWVTEGINEFVKRGILLDLVNYRRVGALAYNLDEVLFYYANGRLGERNSAETFEEQGIKAIYTDPGKQKLFVEFKLRKKLPVENWICGHRNLCRRKTLKPNKRRSSTAIFQSGVEMIYRTNIKIILTKRPMRVFFKKKVAPKNETDTNCSFWQFHTIGL